MVITLVHENKLKVVLTAEDMERFSLRYDQMVHSDPATRKAMVDILEESRGQVRFNPKGSKVYIEVFPCEGDGCVLFFTCLHTAAGGKVSVEPVILQFDSAGDLLDGAVQTYALYRHRIYRSSLYRMKDAYRLIVYPLDYSDRRSIYFLSEYGQRLGEGELLAAYTEEHGKELASDDAIEQLAAFFDGEEGASY